MLTAIAFSNSVFWNYSARNASTGFTVEARRAGK